MFDRIRRRTGIVLILTSLVLCLCGTLGQRQTETVRFRSGTKQEWGISSVATEQNGSVSVNFADIEELTGLPGIGETLAGMIIGELRENGPYYYAEDLESVKGIGPRTLDKFRYMIDLTQGEGER